MKLAAIQCSTENIGDDVQALAALGLLPRKPDLWLDRDHLENFEPVEPTALILSGFFDGLGWPPTTSELFKPIVIGFHGACERVYSKQSLAWFALHEPIGCRDFFTMERLRSEGIRAWFSGCLSLHLQGADAERTDARLSVEGPRLAGWQYSTHCIARTTEKRFELTAQRMSAYSTAGAVVTTRLHCALPCLAFGTPCWFAVKNFQDPRYDGLLDWLNVVSFKALRDDQELPFPTVKAPPKPLIDLVKSRIRQHFVGVGIAETP